MNKKTDFSKRLASIFLVLVYIIVSSPIAIIAESNRENRQKQEAFISATKNKINGIEAKEIDEEVVSQVIKAKEGGTIKLGKASIEIPEYALDNDTEISITYLKDVADTGESLYNAVPDRRGYRFLPAGTQFKKEVIITLPYDPALNKKLTSLEDLYTYFFDVNKLEWIKLERLEIDNKKCIVRSLTTHFTDMINATLTLPESASPVDVNLNSIKNLEAAKPDSHLIKFNPPKADNSGDVNFSFELDIPAGRRGVQPQLSITYSSGAGNGIMGKGFDIRYGSSITTDTRFGLPEYKGEDRYMLDGILLGKKDNSGTYYEPLKESAFEQIKREIIRNNNQEEYSWVVTSKDGTKRFFKNERNACVGTGKQIFTWNITKIQDIYGNNVIYEYDNDSYVYPKAIYYTGKENKKGHYKIEFEYDRDEEGKEIKRQDIRIDARSKSIVVCKKLLTGIKTKYEDTGVDLQLRKYTFEYTEGLASEKKLSSISVWNSSNTEKYEYTFDYNEPEKNEEGSYIQYFAEAQEWTNGQPVQSGVAKNSGSTFNGGGGAGFGLPFVDVRGTAGVSGSSSSGSSYSEDTLIDINGDGRPDSIVQAGNGIKVYLNNGNGFDAQPVFVSFENNTLGTKIDYEANSSSSYGWNVYAGGGLGIPYMTASMGTGYSEVNQRSTSRSLFSFMDVDRDGFTDIVETGTNGYFKNVSDETGLKFRFQNLYTEIKIKDVVPVLSDAEINEYKNTYYVQTPFRAWKAPYDGIVDIEEKLEKANKIYEPAEEVTLNTFYLDRSENSQNYVKKEKKITETSEVYNDIALLKDDDIYFATNHGEEPQNSDVKAGIKISYKKIKALKNNSGTLYFFDKAYEKINFSETVTFDEQDSTEEKKKEKINEIKKLLIKNLSEKLKSDTYLKMYDFVISNEDGVTKISLSYNDKWKSDACKDIYEEFIQKGDFIPSVFTPAQFEKYYKRFIDYKDENIENYKTFARNFIYSVNDNLYKFIGTNNSELLEDIKYAVSSEDSVFDSNEFINNYMIFGIKPVFNPETKSFDYFLSTDIVIDGDDRGTDYPGSQYVNNQYEKILNIGEIEVGSKVYNLEYNMSSDRFSLGNNFSENEILDSWKFNKAEKNKNQTVTIEAFDSKGIDKEFTVTINLSKFNKNIKKISEVEYNAIKELIDIENSDIDDWDIGDEEADESKLENLFKRVSFDEEQKNFLVDCLYEKKEKNIDTDNEETEPQTVIYYVMLKDEAKKKKAIEFLEEYRDEQREKILLNFFEPDVKSGYRLKKNHDKVADELDEQINEYYDKLKIGKYNHIDYKIEYNPDYFYKVRNSSVNVIKLEKDGKLKEHDYEIKTKWDSEEDFSLENKNKTTVIYEYDASSLAENKEYKEYNLDFNSIENSDKNKLKVEILNNEFLYGGKNNWYYGIWRETESFDISKLLEFKNIENNIISDSENATANFASKQAEIKNQKSQLENTDNENNRLAKKSVGDSSVHFYLPDVKNSSEMVKSVQDFSYAYDRNYNLDDALIGTVAFDANEGSGTYYTPFIKGNYIHSERAGGRAYYKIEGIPIATKAVDPEPEQGTNTYLTVPDIRKSFSEGVDITPSISVQFGVSPGKTPDTFKKGTKPEKLNSPPTANNNDNASISPGGINIGLSKSAGKNVSSSSVSQSILDINGDGLPDILQAAGNSINAVCASIDEKGNIQYSKNQIFTGFNAISKSNCVVSTEGISVNPGGSVQIIPAKKPYVLSVPVPSPSASQSSSGGTNIQTSTLIDLNGDGLPDYYEQGRPALINVGNGMSSGNYYTGLTFASNESKSNSSSKNFSISAGIDIKNGTSISSGPSCSIGGSWSDSSSNVTSMFMDINGDGLPDRVSMNVGSNVINVNYNTGNGFSEKKNTYYIPKWYNQRHLFEDRITGDYDSNFDMRYMAGFPLIGFIAAPLQSDAGNAYIGNLYTLSDSLDWNTSATFGLSDSIGVNVNIGINIWVIFYIGTININLTGGAGINASTTVNGVSVKMMDLDGDGLPDHVMRIPGCGTYWKRNLSGTFGQLRQINLPQGGNIQIEYDEMYGTVENPGFKYVMSKVITNDGCLSGDEDSSVISHGEHSITTCYKYANAYYDRINKESYGFEQVKTYSGCRKAGEGDDLAGKELNDFIYETVQTDVYNMREYYLKGTLKNSSVENFENEKLSETEIFYRNSPFAQPVKELSRTYEVSSGNDNYIESCMLYEYGDYGTVTKIIQKYGNGTILEGVIQYDNTSLNSKYIVGLPIKITVKDCSDSSNEEILRCREGIYDSTNGSLIELHQYYDERNYSVHSLKYDSFGNISKVTDPRGATLEYTYDGTEHMFVSTVMQYGDGTDKYESEIEYNIPEQIKKHEIDCNGNRLDYSYDAWQRIISIRTPYDKGTAAAVEYIYLSSSSENKRWYAITKNKTCFDSDEIIETVLEIDGLGRAVRTAKTGNVYNGFEKELGWNVSGAVTYDYMGRVVEEGMTKFISGNAIENLMNTSPSMTELKTSYTYDEKNRKIETVLPDGSKQSEKYEIKDGNQIAYAVDPLGNIAVQTTDGQGNIIEVSKYSKHDFDLREPLTSAAFKYNAIGEMLSAFDAERNEIKISYDLLGRRTSIESEDSGRQEYEYDLSSNIKAETNSVLREKNKRILYEYDGLNRLIKIDYPDTEDTVYTYGGSNAAGGTAGKIQKVTDASGSIEYEYGSLGQIIKEKRILHQYLEQMQEITAITEYGSDYLGRMQYIVYPDGERIEYKYDKGGQVKSVIGSHFAENDFEYVTDIGYDEYGQRVYIEYGNGVRTDYTYDKERRWLSYIKTHNTNSVFQNINYVFDAVGNITEYINNCFDEVNGNYKTKQQYGYDDLYQLIHVTGETELSLHYTVREYSSVYTQDFTFDSIGNMKTKVSTEVNTPSIRVGTDLNYSLDYNYQRNGKSHRLINAGKRYYQYDSNGNVTLESEGSEDNNDETLYSHVVQQLDNNTEAIDYGWGLFKDEGKGTFGGNRQYKREYTWNERNQLIKSEDSTYTTGYVYGQDGQRTNKYTSGSETIYFNKMYTLHVDSGNRVQGGQYAKNIYLGDTRIVTKLGAPGLTDEYLKVYYYHSDHLGSASLVTDYKGDEYQRLEYTPYGEIWVEKTSNDGSAYLPYKFTAKEMDEETGLYYYGARYLDPKYSRWLSTDPALGDYIPLAPTNDEAKKRNSSLPGMGGLFNQINFHLYHYAGNNPVKYTDPDGLTTIVNENDNHVVDVQIDGDTSVLAYPFTSDGQRCEGPAQYYGQTMYVDSFISPDTGNPVGIIYPNKSIDEKMAELSISAKLMGYTKTWYESRSGGQLDIKAQMPGHEGKSYHGFNYEGYIISLREAGNILAGQNAALYNMSYEDFQKGAGALQQKGLAGATAYKFFGITYGTAPYYGENLYQYRCSLTGYNQVYTGVFAPIFPISVPGIK